LAKVVLVAEWSREYVREVCEVIWQAEQRHGLLEWQVDSVFPWQMLRMPIYYSITQQRGFFGDPHPDKFENDEEFTALASAESLWDILKAEEKLSRSRKHFYRCWLSGRAHRVLIPHGRTIDGVDIYTRQLRDELTKHTLLVDRQRSDDSVVDLRSILVINRKYVRKHINIDDLDIERSAFDQALAEIESALSVDLSRFRQSLEHRVKLLIRHARSYERFFRVARTKTLYLTDSYFSIPLVAGAKLAEVKVVELQHGFISEFHLGYSYPHGQRPAYAADELWMFGNYWSEVTPLSQSTRVRVIGAPYVAALAEQHTGKKNPKTIVFTSQGAIGEQLFPLALHAARELPEYQVIFRLHPSESLESFKQMLGTETSVPSNFELSAKTPNIFALLRASEIQVGVFSTTLLEGMALGCRTAILALPGFEYMKPVVERGDASIAHSEIDIVNAILNAPHCKNPLYYYGKPNKKLV